jgi:hypothetical protein
MRKLKKTRFIVIAVTVALLSIALWLGLVNIWTDPDYKALRKFEKAFGQIAIGMERDEIERRLGPPDHIGDEFRLGQREGSEDAYQRAAESDAQYYLIWHRWVDMVFTIGFNAEDKAVVIESGGT